MTRKFFLVGFLNLRSELLREQREMQPRNLTTYCEWKWITRLLMKSSLLCLFIRDMYLGTQRLMTSSMTTQESHLPIA